MFYPFPRPGIAWLAFTCDRHVGQLTAARPLTDQDRAELQHRIAEHAKAMAGTPYDRPQPLARGAAAHQLVARAKAWAERRINLVAGPAQPDGVSE